MGTLAVRRLMMLLLLDARLETLELGRCALRHLSADSFNFARS